ncbi:MAG: hypothetical protein WKF30_05635 [Pyrinomonadaceae bacterium]
MQVDMLKDKPSFAENAKSFSAFDFPCRPSRRGRGALTVSQMAGDSDKISAETVLQ